MNNQGHPTLENRWMPTVSRPPIGWLSIILFAVTAALHFTTFRPDADGLLLMDDAVQYALWKVEGKKEGLWHPHHLLFHPVAVGVGKVLATFGGDDLDNAIRGQQVVAALSGGITAVLLFRFFASISSLSVALLLAAICGMSGGVWILAAVGETFVPSIAMTTGLLVVACRALLLGTPARTTTLVLWLLLAALVRQDSVLVIVALPFLITWRRTLVVCGVAGGLSLLAYVLAWQASGAPLSFLDWILRHVTADIPNKNWGQSLDLAQSGRALALTAVSLNLYGFFVPWVTAASWVGIVIPCVPPRALGAAGRRCVTGLAAYALARFLFFLWWQPRNPEYHVGTLVPLLMIAGVVIRPGARHFTPRVQVPLLVSLLLIAIGGALTILPNQASTAAFRARCATGLAGDRGLIVVLDPFQAMAVRRERPRAKVLDARNVMLVPGAPADPIRSQIVRFANAEREVVFVRDTAIAHRFEESWPFDRYPELVGSLPLQGLLDDQGQIWLAWVQRP
jgi:hypothetical protein